MTFRMPHVVSLAACVAVSVTFVSSQPAYAAQKEQCFVKTNFKTIYKTAQLIGDVPNHELSQELTVADITYTNPDFKVRTEWAQVHADLIDGTGPHTGYFYDNHEDGSVTYGAFKGKVKTVANSDGSWQTSWEGTYDYLGGGGKFKALKGSGWYKGSVSSQNPEVREEGCEKVEY